MRRWHKRTHKRTQRPIGEGKTHEQAQAYAAAIGAGKTHEQAQTLAQAYAAAIEGGKTHEQAQTLAQAYAAAIEGGKTHEQAQTLAQAYAAAIEGGNTPEQAQAAIGAGVSPEQARAFAKAGIAGSAALLGSEALLTQILNSTYAYCNIATELSVADRNPINFLEQCGAWMQEAQAGAAARASAHAAGAVAPTYAGDFILSNDMKLYNDNRVETAVVSAFGGANEVAKKFKAAYIYVNMFESLEIAYLYWVGYYYNTNAALFAYLLKLPLPKDSFEELHHRKLLEITSDFQYDSLPLYSSIRVNTAFNICGGSEHKYKLDQILPLGATTGSGTSPGGDTENVQCVWLNSSDILKKPILTVINLAEQQGIATYQTTKATDIIKQQIMIASVSATTDRELQAKGMQLSQTTPDAIILANPEYSGGGGI